MRYRKFSVTTTREQIETFANFAVQTQNQIIPVLEMRFGFIPQLKQVWKWVQSKYVLFTEESLIAPVYFPVTGGDCDVQMCFFIGYLRSVRKIPDEKIYIIEASEKDTNYYGHIFCGFGLAETLGQKIEALKNNSTNFIKLDALPGLKFNHTFSWQSTRFWRLSDVL